MFLILDGNNIAWAGYYALERAMKPEDDERRARVAILGLAAGIFGAIARGGTAPGAEAPKLTRVAVAFDEGRPLRRRAIYPPYQTGRERDPKFIANEPTILAAIAEFSEIAAKALPIEIVRGVNTEADDLIAGVVQANPRMQTRIVSTDRDFIQLISPTLSVYSPVRKLIIDESNCLEVFTPKGASKMFSRDRLLDYRAMVGDASDDLPGVPGVGALSAVAMLLHAPVEAYIRDPVIVRTALGRRNARIETAFSDGTARDVIERNRTLMDLRLPAPCWSELDALTTRGTWDPKAFDAWIEEQRFSSVDTPALVAQLEAVARRAA